MASSEGHRIICRLDELLKSRSMTMTQLSRTTGITMANLSILKTGKAKAVRFSTLTLICEALDCEAGQLLQLDRAAP
ncbi:helix-turn-helix domain-containing protein [Ornithinimicrobium avium]|uniref:Transcriptional regulator n=1 Tax=Ornithinimicrobium avium TaxID=2283195 RepID=A0A345NQD9_9MICO|nr:helix-turn-helix domain-containing protein [Ornithinimicrobium avium]AXH97247.1 transcriptional regulator [Ornithinimicrobium avium]